MWIIRQFSAFQSHFQMTGQMTSLSITKGCVTSFPATLLPPNASYSPAGREMYTLCEFSAYSRFQVTSGQMTSLPGHFRSREVM